jgi:hypothetical protein
MKQAWWKEAGVYQIYLPGVPAALRNPIILAGLENQHHNNPNPVYIALIFMCNLINQYFQNFI